MLGRLRLHFGAKKKAEVLSLGLRPLVVLDFGRFGECSVRFGEDCVSVHFMLLAELVDTPHEMNQALELGAQLWGVLDSPLGCVNQFSDDHELTSVSVGGIER